MILPASNADVATIPDCAYVLISLAKHCFIVFWSASCITKPSLSANVTVPGVVWEASIIFNSVAVEVRLIPPILIDVADTDVKEPAEADEAPIVVPSMAPPLISAVGITVEPVNVTEPLANVIKSTSDVCPIVDPSIATLSTVSAVRVPTEVMRFCAALIENSEPVFVRPGPAVLPPVAEPENCVNANEVVPRVIEPFVVHTKPLSALAVPSSMKQKAPLTSSLALKSVALVGAPEAFTV